MTTREAVNARNAERGAANDPHHRGKGKIYTLRTLREKGIMYSSVHLRRLIRADRFPRPFYLSDRRPAWTEATLDAWIEGLEGTARRRAAADA